MPLLLHLRLSRSPSSASLRRPSRHLKSGSLHSCALHPLPGPSRKSIGGVASRQLLPSGASSPASTAAGDYFRSACRSLYAVRSAAGDDRSPAPAAEEPWEAALAVAASLYPVYVILGGVVAVANPDTFSFFVSRSPWSYSVALSLIMLAMGLTLQLRDFLTLLQQRALSILFGCAAQYIIMPASGAIIASIFKLPPSLSVGLILLACCPGGTASNVVTLISQGDVALSIVMTICTTLAAVLLTPLLTKILAGAYIPVDAVKLSVSTLQVVVAPILLGSYLQSTFPSAVRSLTPFAPLFAVLASSLLACSVFSENFVRISASLSNSSNGGMLSGDVGTVILSVLLLHFIGFFVGYVSAAICGFKEAQRRAVSIEVGMQNSSLGVVLATAHFSSSSVALPAALSAVIMNVMASTLGFVWKYINFRSE